MTLVRKETKLTFQIVTLEHALEKMAAFHWDSAELVKIAHMAPNYVTLVLKRVDYVAPVDMTRTLAEPPAKLPDESSSE